MSAKGIFRYLFGTPIGSRGTIASILSRKLARRTLRDAMRDEEPQMKNASVEGMEGKLVGLADDVFIIAQKLRGNPAPEPPKDEKAKKEKKAGIAAAADDLAMALRNTAKEKKDEQKKVAHPALAELLFLNSLAKAADLEKEAPFKSEAQRRFMWAKKPELAREFQAETKKGKKLPEHVKKSGLLSWGGMGASMLGKSRMVRGLGMGAMVADGAIQAAKQPTPSMQQAQKLSKIDELLAIMKEGDTIVARNYIPDPTDKGEVPDVKKKSLSDSSNALEESSRGTGESKTSATTSMPSLSMDKSAAVVGAWLKRHRAGTEKQLSSESGREDRSTSAMASEMNSPDSSSGSHIHRPQV